MPEVYKYKFSVIMSVYNTEQWIEEAVESLIKQDIGFEENVQLIFVNDGSTDGGEAICLEYAKRYPDNIIYVCQENQGLSAARNTGLAYREGKYINFFDPDDILTHNVLREVWNFFESHYDQINSVAIPLEYFEAKKGLHPRYGLLGNTNRVIDLNDEPAHAVLSSASSFYKSEVFETLSFDITMFGSEDVKFNAEQYEQCPRFGYVCERGTKYLYRIRHSADSIVSQLSYRPESFRTVRYLFECLCDGKKQIEPYKQEIIIYELRSRLANIRPQYFDKPGEFDEIIDAYREYLRMVDIEHLTSSPFIETNAQRYVFASYILEKEPTGLTSDGRIYFDNETSPTDIRGDVFIKNVEFTKAGLKLDVLSHNFNIPNMNLIIKGQRSGDLEPLSEQVVEGTRYDVSYGIFSICPTTHQQYLIPYSELDEYKFYVRDRKQHKDFLLTHIVIHQYSPFVLNSKYLKIWQGKYAVRMYRNVIKVSKEPNRQWLNNLIICTLILRRNHKVALLRLLNKQRKKYLLFSDRPVVAKDNGEALFAYINKNHPEMARRAYFVLDKSSADIKRMRALGKVVKKGSLRHKYLYLNAQLVVSSHLHPLFLEPFDRKDMFMYRDLLRSKLIWLQHGVNMNDVAFSTNKFNELPFRTIVSSEHEVKEFSRPPYFYPSDQLLPTGLARFDRLYDDTKKIITVMPTWRSYLSGAILSTGANDRLEGFERTYYYQTYRKLLSDKALLQVLKNQGYMLQFILHPGVSAYRDAFKDLGNECVQIIDAQNVDYTKVFAETALLVTDYSSVFFDFAYLYKPTLFYQFDQNDFFSGHYNKSETYDQAKMGPGPVIKDHKSIIKEISKYVNDGCKLEPKYRKRIDKLFLHHDQHNSERIYRHLRTIVGTLEDY